MPRTADTITNTNGQAGTPPADKQRDNSTRKPPGRPFAKGRSGNPNGRPKGRTMTELVRAALARAEGGKPLAEAVAEVIVSTALTGDTTILKELWARLDGKVPDRLITSHAAEVDPDRQRRMIMDPEASALAAQLDERLALSDGDDARGVRPAGQRRPVALCTPPGPAEPKAARRRRGPVPPAAGDDAPEAREKRIHQ